MYTLYCSLFHPYLSYCNDIWGNTHPSNVKCLFLLQTKAYMLICKADILAHPNAMFKDMFNLFHGSLPIQLQRRFTKYLSVLSTRQNKSFVMVQVRTNLKAMCLSLYGVKLWNTLPDDIENSTSVNILKKCLKNISYHTIRPVCCNKLIIHTTLFTIDQSNIMVHIWHPIVHEIVYIKIIHVCG